jgi:arylsulfatase A-like enzyme
VTRLGWALAAVCILAGVAILHHNAPHRAVASRSPSILLVTLDTVRYSETGLAPGGTNSTPFLSALAATQTSFSNCYSTFDSTPESHFSMLTGFKVGWGDAHLDRTEHTLQYQLARYGYATFAIVANGNLSAQSNRHMRGFDEFQCLYDDFEALSPAERIAATRRAARVITQYRADANDFNRAMLYGSADEVLRRFEHALPRDGRSFFGLVNLIDAHDPYFPDPGTYDAAAEGRLPEGFSSDLRTRALPAELRDPSLIHDPAVRKSVEDTLVKADHRAWQTAFDLTPAAQQIYRGRYQAEIRQLDRAVRRIFEILDRANALSSTIVIITSDHGESLGEDHLLTHSFRNRGAFEATRHVPLIICLPPSYARRARVLPRLVSSADIAPTIYDLAGIDAVSIAAIAPLNYGSSLRPFLSDGGPAQYRGRANPVGRGPSAADADRDRENAEKRLRALGYLR